MSQRFRYLLGVVFLLVVLSAFADARQRHAEAVVQAATGEKCAECAAYAPLSGVYAPVAPIKK